MLNQILNLLILGSLLRSPDSGQVVPSALWWIPGSIVVVAFLASLAAAVGAAGRDADDDPPDWTSVQAKVGVTATFLLVIGSR